MAADEEFFLPLGLVLDVLDAHEDEAAGDGDAEEGDAEIFFAELCGADAPGHGEGGEDQHDRVESAEGFVEVLVGEYEDLGVVGAVDGVGAEETGEEEDFGGKEEPGAELAGIELLDGSIKVMGEEGGLGVGVVVLFVSTVIVGAVGGCGGGRHSCVLRGSEASRCDTAKRFLSEQSVSWESSV